MQELCVQCVCVYVIFCIAAAAAAVGGAASSGGYECVARQCSAYMVLSECIQWQWAND